MAIATDPRGCAGTWQLYDNWSGHPTFSGLDTYPGFELDNPTWQLAPGSSVVWQLVCIGTDSRVLFTASINDPSSTLYSSSKTFVKSDSSCETAAPVTTYDSISGTCVLSSTYGTPGNYATLAACNAAIGDTCPPCPPCASCPSGQTCIDSSGEEVNFVNISAPVFSGNCDNSGNPVYNTQTVGVILGTETAELLKLQELAQIKGNAVCKVDVAAIPDGWLIRPEYHRSQVIYQFAKIDNGGNIVGAPMYKITVPHHIADKPDAPLPNYQRGNWETIFVLKDNSRVTIHSRDEANGTTMLNAIKLRIDPAYLVGSYLSKSSLVVTDNEIAQINVKNRMAKYFSTGAKNELPDWIVKW